MKWRSRLDSINNYESRCRMGQDGWRKIGLYQFDCILRESCEDQGWFYMAEIPALPGGWDRLHRQRL